MAYVRSDGGGEFFQVRIENGRPVTAGAPCVHISPSAGSHPTGAPHHLFAGWQWDGRCLRIVGDRYGICPVFYIHSGDEFAVGRSVEALLGVGRTAAIDYDAVAAFLRLGFFLDEDTPFRNIRALAPGASIEWENGHTRVSASRPRALRLYVSRDVAIDRYIALFRQAIARRLPEWDFCLPLSGGRDSRHILFELARAGRPPRLCITCDRRRPGYEDERHVARRVARAIGVEHLALGAAPMGLAPDRWAIRQQNYCSEEGGWFRPCADFLLRQSKPSYDGIAGDMWAECSFNTKAEAELFRGSDANEIARKLLDYWRRDAHIELLLSAPAYRNMSHERAVERIAAAVRPHQDSPNPLASFYFWNRTRRKIALMPLGVLSRVPMHCPFLDDDLFDFVSNLPADVMRSGSFHTEVLARAFPDMSYLPYSSVVKGAQNWTGLGADLVYVAHFVGHVRFQRRLARSAVVSSSLLATLRKASSVRFVRRAVGLAFYLMELEERLAALSS